MYLHRIYKSYKFYNNDEHTFLLTFVVKILTTLNGVKSINNLFYSITNLSYFVLIKYINQGFVLNLFVITNLLFEYSGNITISPQTIYFVIL